MITGKRDVKKGRKAVHGGAESFCEQGCTNYFFAKKHRALETKGISEFVQDSLRRF
jgi:hypothetical protein